jgi:hypothetical protein
MRFDQDLENLNIGGSFAFSATRIDKLNSSEYTLVTIVLDISGSVGMYAPELEKAVVEVVNSCKKSPRVDNLMLRLIMFNNQVQEFHGFKLFQNCNTDDYLNSLNCNGSTALFDAAFNAIKAQNAYTGSLLSNDYNVNGIMFVITDGDDNASSMTPTSIKDEIEKTIRSECLSSFVSVLIGVDSEPRVKQFLQNFKDEAGFTQYVSMGDANANKLSKLADFVSKSVSSSSSALATGGPSKSINITF